MSETPDSWPRRSVKGLAAFGVGSVVFFSPFYAVHIAMPGSSFTGPLPPLTGHQEALSLELEGHVTTLATQFGDRNVLWRPTELEAAATYVEDRLGDMGYTPVPHVFEVNGVPVRNLIVELPGGRLRDEIVIVGAHYDTAPGNPGADDNGSGTAALLALARRFHGRSLPRTLRFVAFVNEEPPHFQRETMGSLQYAHQTVADGDQVVAMFSLETIGYYRDEPGSQAYPFPFSVLYPSTGDFIGFIGDPNSRGLVRQSVRLFRDNADFPSQGAALPKRVPGVGWSDQWSFWQVGVPAVMVTDTAPNRNPHYHEPTDTPDQLDFGRMARVVDGLAAVIEGVASE